MDYIDIENGVAGLAVGINNSVVAKVCAEDIKFGEVAVGYKGDNRVFKFRKETSKLVFGGDLVTSNSTIVAVNGVDTTAVVFASSHAATMALLVNAIKAIPVSASNPFGVEAVLDTTDAASRTILIRTKGATIATNATVTLGAGQTTDTSTYSASGYFKGVAMFVQLEGGLFVAKKSMSAIERGRVMVPTAGAVNANMPAFVNDSGVFATSGTALSGCIFDSNTSGAGLAELVVNGQVAISSISGSF